MPKVNKPEATEVVETEVVETEVVETEWEDDVFVYKTDKDGIVRQFRK